jgi:hypothetical protein
MAADAQIDIEPPSSSTIERRFNVQRILGALALLLVTLQLVASAADDASADPAARATGGAPLIERSDTSLTIIATPRSSVPQAAPLVQQSTTSVSADGSCTPADQCCKVCSKGKACGNTCISASYECHVGPGCACNSTDICK